MTAYYSLFKSHLRYGLIVWGGTRPECTGYLQRRLQGTQNTDCNITGTTSHLIYTTSASSKKSRPTEALSSATVCLKKLSVRNLKTSLMQWLLDRPFYTLQEFLNWRA
ncbi:hypothetical protein J6590_080419 [Homalodisca vitripennis]|nr:hypothetical protein J6590_080419 [Homalodisca vitripennis]